MAQPKKLLTLTDEDIERLERLRVRMQMPSSSAVIRKLIRQASGVAEKT